MQMIVTRQIAVEAETPEEALEKTKPSEGNSISFSVNPRPQSPQVMGSAKGTIASSQTK